jgi:hypothetical protein
VHESKRSFSFSVKVNKKRGYIQNGSGGKINIFGGDSIGLFEEKEFMCKCFESPDLIPLDYLFVEMYEESSQRCFVPVL